MLVPKQDHLSDRLFESMGSKLLGLEDYRLNLVAYETINDLQRDCTPGLGFAIPLSMDTPLSGAFVSKQYYF